MPEAIDLLVLNAHLFSMRGEGVGYIANGALAVRDTRIVDIGLSRDLESRYQAAQVLNADQCAVLPGLIDAHMHSRYALLRGVAQDVGHWMQGALTPFSQHLDPQASHAGTRLNILEALLAGTTTIGDFLEPYPGWAECFLEAGIRARLTPTINALPQTGMAGWEIGALYPLSEDAGKARLDHALAFCDQCQNAGEGRITTMLGPQAADMLTRELLVQTAREAAERQLMLHMHVAQGDREIEQMMKRHGQRTPAYLDSLGLLNEQLLAVHLTEADAHETRLIASRGASMVVCSGSIGIIDGIVPPALAFRDAGGRVALGSDQAAGNNCNNIFNEMKLTALFNKIHYRNPEAMPAWEVLRMATIEGARAIGLGDQIGSLETGKQADFILVDLNCANLSPVIEEPIRNIVPNLVYAASGHEVHTVVVAGKILVSDHQPLDLPVRSIRAQAQQQAERIAAAVIRDPAHRQLRLMNAMATECL